MERRIHIQRGLLLLVGHSAVAAICIVTGLWMLPVVISLGRYYGTWLHLLCNATEHIRLSDNVDDYRLCCRTIELNPITRFLYWQKNYHTEHHMYAAVPCYNLRALHRLVRDDLPQATRLTTWGGPATARLTYISRRFQINCDAR